MRLLTLISIIFWAFVPISLIAAEAEGGARIVVIGQGEAKAAPNQAVIRLGARHFAETASDALAQTSTATAAILAQLKAAGIAPADIQTSSISLNPVWDDYRKNDGTKPRPPAGFEAANQVSVTVRDLASLGSLLDQVAQDGANAFSGFRFGLSDPAPLQVQARSAAIADARAKAAQYARDAGLVLGDVLLVTEEMGDTGGGYPPPVMEMAAARSAPVPVAAGEITLRRSVKVIFAAQP